MMKNILMCLLLCGNSVFAQQKILHYSETSGFDHNTRTESLQMFEAIASSQGWQVVNDQNGDEFNSLANLQQYEVVVFSNTSGDDILNASQRNNFEAYVASGGSFLGIHAASDTYRHSTANGSNTGTWDFYAELVGASVQQNPNHVNGTPQYSMDVIGSHASTQNIPNPWTKNEEYYYWENGYLNAEIVPVLEVEETTGPNNLVNSYDAVRPMSWHRILPEGGKIFYTALGHSSSNFSSDQNFISHITDAVQWILSETVGLEDSNAMNQISIAVQNETILIQNVTADLSIALYNSVGQMVFSARNQTSVFTRYFSPGIYILTVTTEKKAFNQKLFLNP